MKSWKTTLAGALAAIGAALTQSNNSTVHLIGVLATALGTFLLGASAADHAQVADVKTDVTAVTDRLADHIETGK